MSIFYFGAEPPSHGLATMAGDVEELAQASVFVLVGFVLGQVGGLIHAQLVGEIVAGVLLGDEVMGWLPYQDAIQLLGRVGLVLLVMEGGLSVDITLLPRCAPGGALGRGKACV
jgi:Kef-type K+ transport system membrane component KefB